MEGGSGDVLSCLARLISCTKLSVVVLSRRRRISRFASQLQGPSPTAQDDKPIATEDVNIARLLLVGGADGLLLIGAEFGQAIGQERFQLFQRS